jgi:WD40 repeat protein
MLASRGPGHELLLRQVPTGKVLARLPGHDKEISALRFAPDGKTLASADAGGTVRVWDLATRGGRPVARRSVGEARHLAFSPDGKLLVAATDAGKFWTWDVATGKDLARLPGHPAGIHCLAISPAGRTVAAGDDKGVQLWDLASGRAAGSLPHTHPVGSLAFSPDHRLLATGHWAQLAPTAVRLWDLGTLRERVSFKPDALEMGCLAFAPDGKRLFVLGNPIRVYDVPALLRRQRPTSRALLRGHKAEVRSADFSPDSTRLATASDDHTVKVWDVRSGRESFTLRGHTAHVVWVHFSPDGRTLVSASVNEQIADEGPGEVKVWDAATGKERVTLKGPRVGGDPLLLSPDSQTLALSGYGYRAADDDSHSAVMLYHLATGNRRPLKGSVSDVGCLVFSPDSKTLATGCAIGAGQFTVGGEVQLWEVTTGGLRRTWTKRPGGAIVNLVFSPDGNRLAAFGRAFGPFGQSFDDGITVWTVLSGMESLRLKSATEPPLFTRDGKGVLSVENGSVRAWDLATGKSRVLIGDLGKTGALLLSPDGKVLLSSYSPPSISRASDGSFTCVWDLTTGRKLAVLEDTWPLALSPDGRTLATSGTRGGVILWDVPALVGPCPRE